MGDSPSLLSLTCLGPTYLGKVLRFAFSSEFRANDMRIVK